MPEEKKRKVSRREAKRKILIEMLDGLGAQKSDRESKAVKIRESFDASRLASEEFEAKLSTYKSYNEL